ncbi:14451_t:CDS:2 [Funneliformis caledonium]|uniref:14451_t:CDS:1 n=1 Tax=Funneliformis caledonium TaxID=1117310 RepID=A0A9N8WL00_9GLOM|nr:14451_t:CDS:2 [Funneliformis caledonium]
MSSSNWLKDPIRKINILIVDGSQVVGQLVDRFQTVFQMQPGRPFIISFNCNIYIIKVNMNIALRNTELDKQSLYILNTFEEYKRKCKKKKMTLTHIKYFQKILENLEIIRIITQAQ